MQGRKEKLLYSVIIPIYNSDKYLRACLNSILQQVFKEYEIILVDDGSVDDSGNICDEYARKYSNISVFFVYVNIKDTITKEKIPTNFVVIVDFENETYNILPSEYMDSIEIQEESNFELNIKQIEANQYNSFEYKDIDKNTIILDNIYSYYAFLKFFE